MKIGFIGGGKMAEAIAAAVLTARLVRCSDIVVSDISPERRRRLRRVYGVTVVRDNRETVKRADTVFLAVKPQDLDQVLAEIAPAVTDRKLMVSIAAGRKLASIESCLTGARVVRVMPNLPCLVREAMSVFCLGANARASDRRWMVKLLSSFGRVLELPEEQFDAVTALSGSGPGFLAYLLGSLAEGAELEGLSKSDAWLLARQTMLGTARLLLEKNLQAAELISAVASAKGTTVAGLEVLEKGNVSGLLKKAIAAAARRSRDLSG